MTDDTAKTEATEAPAKDTAAEQPKDDKDTNDTPTATATTGFKTGTVQAVPLDEIDLEDETYRFRTALRIGPLADSMKANGLQVPIILRARKRGQRKFQLVSGFRRCTAAKKLGWQDVTAVVRDDLDTDEDAFKAAVVENTNRKTYSDIDRAVVVAEYRRRGFKGDDDVPMAVLGLTKRQQRNLLSLLKLPKTVQDAVDDPEQGFSSTHALTLRQLKGKYPKLAYATWIKRVNDGGLSVAQLKRAVNKELGGDGGGKDSGFTGLFRDDGTDAKKGVFRFNPVAVDVGKLSDGEKKALKGELEKVLARL